MSDDLRKPTCEEFQRQFPELLATAWISGTIHHVKACAICSQLLHDIESIAENARHVRFGINEPGTDDWSEST